MPNADKDKKNAPPEMTKPASPLLRPALLLFGWAMVGLGAVGVFVPGLPTVPFLLLALWAFARSSQRFHDWLYTHPRFGPPLRDWRDHRVIPPRAKFSAIAMMCLSLAVIFYLSEGWQLPVIVGCCLIPPAIFILTRSSRRGV